MITLLLLTIIGLMMAFFSTQNVVGVPLTLANYTFTNIPLYMVVLGSLLFGIVISSFVGLVHTISSSLTIHGKDTALRSSQRTIEKLKEENQKLELDLARFKTRREEPIVVDRRSDNSISHPNFLDRLRQSFSY